MVYGVMRLINFAHGELFMLGSYLRITLLVSTSIGKLGWSGTSRRCPHGCRGDGCAWHPHRTGSLCSLKVGQAGACCLRPWRFCFLANAAMLIWGSRYRAYPVWAALDRRWQIGGVHITLMQGIILGVSIILMLLLYCMIQRTTLGAAIRATAIDQETARLMGIDVNAIIRFIFIIGPALGAVAGVMVGLYYRQLHFTMGWTYSLKAFTAAIMGGIGNIPGAMVGGMLLGILEMLGAGYISAAWKDVFVFIILIALLILRPTGLLGERVAEKV